MEATSTTSSDESMKSTKPPESRGQPSDSSESHLNIEICMPTVIPTVTAACKIN